VNPKVRAYFELLRFPAVFTAIADVMMGFLVTQGELHPGRTFALVAATSALLYLSGMVFNDVFDSEVDAVERPHRPIPSQRISYRSALVLGGCLMGLGLLVSAHIGQHNSQTRTAFIAIALASCILLYDGGAKRTFAGPLVMGSCRVLNVLLGMSLATAADGMRLRPWHADELLLAAGMGVYVAGLTIFARGEARAPSRPRLLAGMLTMLAGLLSLMASGRIKLRPADSFTESESWPLLWLALSVVILGRCLWAIWQLDSRATQLAVRSSLRAIIMIDAAIVLGFCGPFWAWCVIALLVPMFLLERWASTT
jgi:hypothetical protein